MLTTSYDVFTGTLRSVTAAHQLHKPGVNRGALVCLGAGANVTALFTDPGGTDDYARAHVPNVTGNLAANLLHFGNDTAITGLANLWTHATTQQGFRTDKFALIGGSMGALVGLNYLVSLANPASVCACAVLAIPPLDLDAIYQSDAGGYRSDIETAYSITHPTAIPNLATHSPAAYSGANKAKLTMPIRIWASDDDTIASTTTQCETWAATLPDCDVISMGNLGHTDNTDYIPDRVAFVTEHLAG